MLAAPDDGRSQFVLVWCINGEAIGIRPQDIATG